MDRPDPDQCEIECRAHKVLVVRVRSCDRQGRPLPDAVFTFRPGDPQYDDWHERMRRQRRDPPGGVEKSPPR